jgi:NADH:ubiquinone oxidoreductase subunit 4 (subunit M)
MEYTQSQEGRWILLSKLGSLVVTLNRLLSLIAILISTAKIKERMRSFVVRHLLRNLLIAFDGRSEFT